MAIRLSGLNSGMDTESIIQELVKDKAGRRAEKTLMEAGCLERVK